MNSYNLEKLDEILFSVGIVVDTLDEDSTIDMDSLTFVSLIVEIENTYGISVPSNMLVFDNWCTIKKIKQAIHSLMNT